MNDPNIEHRREQEAINPISPDPLVNAGNEKTPQGTILQAELEALFQDPVGFIQRVAEATVNESAEKHLANMKEEVELKAAINTFKKTQPDFDRFRPFILQEVAELIQNDPDGHIEDWDKLLGKGMSLFQEKFKAQVQQGIPINSSEQGRKTPHIESATMRQLKEAVPEFSRKQIANMSLQDFLKHETDIDKALRDRRIH